EEGVRQGFKFQVSRFTKEQIPRRCAPRNDSANGRWSRKRSRGEATLRLYDVCYACASFVGGPLDQQQQQQPGVFDPCQATTLLRKEMGLIDVVLFNIAAVLGPRWIARAAHVGETSLTMWVVAALFFFVPTALVISELSTRYPHEGGLYAWTKEAFGDFH